MNLAFIHRQSLSVCDSDGLAVHLDGFLQLLKVVGPTAMLTTLEPASLSGENSVQDPISCPIHIKLE